MICLSPVEVFAIDVVEFEMKILNFEFAFVANQYFQLKNKKNYVCVCYFINIFEIKNEIKLKKKTINGSFISSRLYFLLFILTFSSL